MAQLGASKCLCLLLANTSPFDTDADSLSLSRYLLLNNSLSPLII